MKQLDVNELAAATKVIYRGNWYVVVDGLLYAGAVLGGSPAPVRTMTADEAQIRAALLLALPRPQYTINTQGPHYAGRASCECEVCGRRPAAGEFHNPAMSALTEQQRKDAAAILRGTKPIPLRQQIAAFKRTRRRGVPFYLNGRCYIVRRKTAVIMAQEELAKLEASIPQPAARPQKADHE